MEQLALVTARERIDVSPITHSGLYWATVGGMGLTGAIAEATLRLRPIETAFMAVDTTRVANLEECMAELSASDERYRYSVAWVDCGARGRQLGRSMLSRGDHARLTDLPTRQQDHAFDYRPSTPLNVPITSPFNLVVPAAVRAGNALWYRQAPLQRVGEIQSLSSFFYPLDAVANWNRLYGPRGFTQYQFVVPFGEEPLIRKAIEHLHACGVGPSLGVLKRFGEADPAPLSFPMPGWTPALDLPLGGPAIGPVLDQLDELVAGAEGVSTSRKTSDCDQICSRRCILASRSGSRRGRIDLGGIFTSDPSRRLGVPSE